MSTAVFPEIAVLNCGESEVWIFPLNGIECVAGKGQGSEYMASNGITSDEGDDSGRTYCVLFIVVSTKALQVNGSYGIYASCWRCDVC